MVEKNKQKNKKTCEYNYNNYKLISYEDGKIYVPKSHFFYYRW